VAFVFQVRCDGKVEEGGTWCVRRQWEMDDGWNIFESHLHIHPGEQMYDSVIYCRFYGIQTALVRLVLRSEYLMVYD
jgi:hypothetical protein